MTDETPDNIPIRPNQYNGGPYGPYGYDNYEETKPWYESRTIISLITAMFGAVLLLLKASDIIKWSSEILTSIQTLVVSSAVLFARLGNRRIVSGKQYNEMRMARDKQSEESNV